jgi:hypothetical protein
MTYMRYISLTEATLKLRAVLNKSKKPPKIFFVSGIVAGQPVPVLIHRRKPITSYCGFIDGHIFTFFDPAEFIELYNADELPELQETELTRGLHTGVLFHEVPRGVALQSDRVQKLIDTINRDMVSDFPEWERGLHTLRKECIIDQYRSISAFCLTKGRPFDSKAICDNLALRFGVPETLVTNTLTKAKVIADERYKHLLVARHAFVEDRPSMADVSKFAKKTIEYKTISKAVRDARMRAYVAKPRLETTFSIYDVMVNDAPPTVCPVFRFPLDFAYEGKKTLARPMVSRINNTKGYVPGNVHVASYLAYRLTELSHTGGVARETSRRLLAGVHNSAAMWRAWQMGKDVAFRLPEKADDMTAIAEVKSEVKARYRAAAEGTDENLTAKDREFDLALGEIEEMAKEMVQQSGILEQMPLLSEN